MPRSPPPGERTTCRRIPLRSPGQGSVSGIGQTAHIEQYLDEIHTRLQACLGDDLKALILTGSAAFGELQPGSDLDLIAVSRAHLDADTSHGIAERLSHRVLPCPARRLELVLYPAAELREPSRRPAFDLNLNTGADGVDHAGLDPGAEASHWFLIDLSIARQAGRALAGPPPQRVFPELPRDWLLEAILESIEWHAGNSPGTPSAVLNACRGWNFAATGTWTSKPAAGAWAATRVDGPQRVVIEAAMEARELGSEEPVEGHSEVGLAPHIVLELRRLRDPTPG